MGHETERYVKDKVAAPSRSRIAAIAIGARSLKGLHAAMYADPCSDERSYGVGMAYLCTSSEVTATYAGAERIWNSIVTRPLMRGLKSSPGA